MRFYRINDVNVHIGRLSFKTLIKAAVAHRQTATRVPSSSCGPAIGVKGEQFMSPLNYCLTGCQCMVTCSYMYKLPIQ